MAFFLRLRISFQRKLRLDILATGEYTGIRRFWREYLRMRFRREGGGADYLLFFYVNKVIEIRFSVGVITNEQRPTINGIMVYVFFRVQNRNRELRIIPIPTVFCILCVP